MVVCPVLAGDDQLPQPTYMTVEEIKAALTHLRETYNPPVRGTRVVCHQKIFPSTVENSLEPNIRLALEPLEAGGIQLLNRKPVCDWLTALISHLQKWTLEGRKDFEAYEGLLDATAALLSIFAGTASAGKLNRTLVFDYPPSSPVRVEVTDIPLENRDYTTLGAQTWGGAHILAKIIIQNPHRFCLLQGQSYPAARQKLQILELGAGTGLVSLSAYRLLASKGLSANIYATDFNPLTLDNLARNISINTLAKPETDEDLKISCGSLDWSNPDAADADLFNTVDLVLGADVIYEELHALWIRTCLEKFMRKPQLDLIQPMCHLVIPLRPTHTFESNTIKGIFPLRSENSGQHGWELAIFSKDIILCEASDDEVDGQVEYAYYTIGWESKTLKLNTTTT